MIGARALNLAMVGAAAGLWVGCEGKKILCTSDGECPGGVCDREVGRCAEKSCSSDPECGPGLYCDQLLNVCLFIPDGGGGDGGPSDGGDGGRSDGGGDGGRDGGGDGGPSDGGDGGGLTCVPACPVYQVCQGTVCLARYSGISVVEPSSGQFIDGGGTPVRAQLNVANGFQRMDPATLTLILGLPDGGSASGGTLAADGGTGAYQGTWQPSEDGLYQLTAQYDLAGLASPAISVIADMTPPSFMWTVPIPVRDGGMYIDPAPGFADAWRRDETFTLDLSSSEPNMLPSTVTLRVIGIPGAVSPLLSVTQSTGCPEPYCGRVMVDMSQPDMKAFRGVFGLVVTGHDRAGNVGSTDGGVHVTRWKWINQLTSYAITTAPAIGSTGTIYVGSQNDAGVLGTAFALNTDGTQKWIFDGGAVTASPVVGVKDAGIDSVYVAMNDSIRTTVRALDGTIASQSPIACATADGGAISGPLALGASAPDGGGLVETAFGVVKYVNGGRLLAVRPDAMLVDQCRFVDNVGIVGTPTLAGGLVHDGVAVYLGSDNSLSVKSYRLVSDVWAPAWTVDAGYATHGLAITGNSLVAGGYGLGGSGKLLSLPTDGGPVSWIYGDGGSWNPSISSSNTITYGDDGSRLNSVILNAGAGIYVPLDGGISGGVSQGAPLVGRDGLIYVAATDSNLSVFDPGLSLQWRIQLLAPVEGSLAIDCARTDLGVLIPGRPGVLYVATTGGQVYALIADSLGLDTDAGWPKYQHDPRNTGNSATSLSLFACPP